MRVACWYISLTWCLCLAGCSGGDDANGGDGGDLQTYCGIIKTTIRVCDGQKNESYSDLCFDDADDCAEHLPDDTREGTDTCYTRTEHSVFARGPQEGTCEDYFAYFAGELECLLDKHCSQDGRCIDHVCVCNAGADCSSVGPGQDGGDSGYDGGGVDGGPGPGDATDAGGPGPGDATDAGGPSECTVAEDCPELPPPYPGGCYIRHCVDGVCEPEEASGPDCP